MITAPEARAAALAARSGRDGPVLSKFRRHVAEAVFGEGALSVVVPLPEGLAEHRVAALILSLEADHYRVGRTTTPGGEAALELCYGDESDGV
jgi:hypothetical protein